jgi:pimeloyl-ACP methyl ester carboxylesterase
VRLWYLDTGGAGDPVVFLHPHTGTSETFLPQLGGFSEAGYRAVAFDRRGSGRSERRDDTGPQPGSLAGDLDALLDHLGIGRAHLVAVAGGAFAGIDYAAWKPARVRCLVAGATMASIEEPDFLAFYARVQIPELLGLPHLYELSPGYRGSDPAGVERWRAIESGAHRPDAERQELRTPNTYAKIATVSVPVLALAGGADLIAPPALMRLWTEHLPDVEFSVLPETGHAVSWEDPAAFNAIVLDFLRRH